jgi:two-component system, sporulation sensor kinase D
MKHETAPDYRRLMTRMVDVIAHDIRNPLNNILLSTAQFKLEALPDKEDTSFYIDIIERSCDRVNSLLEEIIAILHQPGLNPDTFDITELMKELVNEIEERLALKDIKINTSLNEVVVARFDRAMMKQALFNVIDNAVDASEKNQVISLKVFEEGADVKLIIADKGKGIPKDIQSHIFAPFYTTKERHKGLGLALTRNVIEAHQGSISLHSSEAGTEVTITIPKNA